MELSERRTRSGKSRRTEHEISRKRARQHEDSFTISALDIALEHIARHSLIQDRPTLLTARLVCKHWRSHDAFGTGKITDITIRKLAQFEALVKYQSVGPVPRGTWPIPEQTKVFPNLATLKFDCSSRVEFQEWWQYPARIWREACLQYELCTTDLNMSSVIGHFKRLRILKFAKITNVIPVGKQAVASNSMFYQLADLHSLTRIAFSLASYDTNNEWLSKFSALQSLTALRDIHLDASLESCGQLASVLTLCTSLTSLTSLSSSVILEPSTQPGESTRVAFADVRRTLMSIPLPCPGKFRVKISDSYASYESGRLSECELAVRLYINTRQPVVHVNQRVSQMLTSAGGGRGLPLALKLFIPALPFADEQPSAVQEPFTPDFHVTRLVFVGDKGMDSLMWLPSLSVFLGGLKHLHLSMFQSDSTTSHSVLTALSHLTHLSIAPCKALASAPGADASKPWKRPQVSYPPIFDTAYLPARLCELDLTAKTFKTSKASLTHLTSLRLNAGDAKNPLSAFSRCGAPLRKLELLSQQSLMSIASAFPCLEKLSCDVVASDVKALGELKLLHELDLFIREDVGMVVGLSHLTQLAKLRIIGNRRSAISLLELRQLTTIGVLSAKLRACNYSIHSDELCADIEEEKGLRYWWQAFKQQSEKIKNSMPMTSVNLSLLYGTADSEYHPAGRAFY